MTVSTAATTAPAAGSIQLLDGDVAFEVVGLTRDTILVLGRPSRNGNLRLRFRFGRGEVRRPVAVESMEPTETEGSGLTRCRMASSPALERLAERASTDVAADYDLVAAVRDVAEETPPPAAASGRGRVVTSVAAWIALGAAIALFCAASYQRFGVVRLDGSVSADQVDLVRAERQGVFFPYTAAHNRRLAKGELIGVIEGVQGQPTGVVATCDCYLGDFPVNAGSTVYKGAAIARLIHPEDRTIVSAILPPGQDWQIAVGDPAEVTLGGQTLKGHVSALRTNRQNGYGDPEEAEIAAANAYVPATVTVALDEVVTSVGYGGSAEIRVLRARAVYERLRTGLGL